MTRKSYLRATQRRLGIAAMLCLAAATALLGQASSIEGQRVVDIRVVDDAGHPVEQKFPSFPLAAGQPFRIEAERDTLRQLYRMGDFFDIRAEAAPVGGGVRVDFIVRQNYYNNVVHVEGLREPPTEAQALSALRLGLGEPFRASTMREALARLSDTLREGGFYQAKLEHTLAPNA